MWEVVIIRCYFQMLTRGGTLSSAMPCPQGTVDIFMHLAHHRPILPCLVHDKQHVWKWQYSAPPYPLPKSFKQCEKEIIKRSINLYTPNIKYIDCNLLQVPTTSTWLLSGKKLLLPQSPWPRSLPTFPFLFLCSHAMPPRRPRAGLCSQSL